MVNTPTATVAIATAIHCATRNRSAEHDDAEQNGDQRIDEVAERRLDDLSAVDAVDVRAPVERDDDGSDRQQAESAPIPQQLRQTPTRSAKPRAARRTATKTRRSVEPGSRSHRPARVVASTAGNSPHRRYAAAPYAMPRRCSRSVFVESRPQAIDQVSLPAISFANASSSAGVLGRRLLELARHQVVVRRPGHVAEDTDGYVCQLRSRQSRQIERERRVVVMRVVNDQASLVIERVDVDDLQLASRLRGRRRTVPGRRTGSVHRAASRIVTSSRVSASFIGSNAPSLKMLQF